MARRLPIRSRPGSLFRFRFHLLVTLLGDAMSVRQVATVLFLVGLVALAGCGGGGADLAVVKGKISYKGKPVPHGTVNFLPNDGNKPMATGEIQPDGSYEL